MASINRRRASFSFLIRSTICRSSSLPDILPAFDMLQYYTGFAAVANFSVIHY
jgi:hypothetical protein